MHYEATVINRIRVLGILPPCHVMME